MPSLAHRLRYNKRPNDWWILNVTFKISYCATTLVPTDVPIKKGQMLNSVIKGDVPAQSKAGHQEYSNNVYPL